MTRLTRRLACVPAATLVLGSLFTLAAPAASACVYFNGPPFSTATAGVLTPTNQYDYWTTQSNGATTFVVAATDRTTQFYVYDANCGVTTCYSSCTITTPGRMVFEVSGGIGAYTIAAVSTGRPPAGTCNVVNTAGVCVNVATGDVVEQVSVYNVELGSSGSHTAVGRIDQYRFPLPTGGSIVLPCVVLTVNGLGSSGCGVGNGTYVGTVATLVNQSVPQPSAGLGDALLTVGVCEAAVTVTAAGFGVEQFPLYSVC